MDRNREIEKKFTEFLDRILAVKEAALEPGADEELRANVEFAARMVSLRPEPAESYRNNLRARLLHQLEASEAATREKRESFWGTLWRKPVWQGAIMVAFAVFVVGMLWRAGVISWEPSEPTATSIPATTSPGTTAPPATTAPTSASQPHSRR